MNDTYLEMVSADSNSDLPLNLTGAYGNEEDDILVSSVQPIERCIVLKKYWKHGLFTLSILGLITFLVLFIVCKIDE
jgi:hypothetical protein